LIGVRGNSSLTYVNTSLDENTVPRLNCTTGAPPASFAECDAQHQIEQTPPPNAPSSSNSATPIQVPDEPYALALDRQNQLLYVGHLKGATAHPDSGGVSVFDAAGAVNADGVRDAPLFYGPFAPIFPPDVNGFFGVTSLMVSGAMGNPHELFVS